VVVVGNETIRGVPLRVRSTHLYAQGGEVVADSFAPPRDFARLDPLVPVVAAVPVGKTVRAATTDPF